jgi:hypothetical protein
MAGKIELKAPLDGVVTLEPEDTASNYTVTLPATAATLLTDSAGVLNIGSGQVYKDASGNVMIGGTTPSAPLDVVSTTNSFALKVSDGTSNGGFLLSSNGTLALYTPDSTGLSFWVNDTEAAQIDVNRNFSINQTPGRYTVDTASGATTIAASGTVDFPNASGFLIVNNHTTGANTIYLSGGGTTTVIGSAMSQVGTFTYNSGIGGYTFTNTSGSSATFGFFFVRTRPTA